MCPLLVALLGTMSLEMLALVVLALSLVSGQLEVVGTLQKKRQMVNKNCKIILKRKIYKAC